MMFAKSLLKTLRRPGGARPFLFYGGLLALFGAAFLAHSTSAAEEAKLVPAAQHDVTDTSGSQVAVLAGGCFWGVQGVFQHVKGVIDATSGYAGGSAATAHYEMVESGTTGHAETVHVTFDPKTVSYGKLLQIYFSVAHDPTQVNRQGPDAGPQYRSAIFPQTGEQATIAMEYIEQLDTDKVFNAKIATTIEPDTSFYRAEEYHQNYMANNSSQPYIVFNEQPKIANLKRLFPQLYRENPVLVAEHRG